MKRLPMMAMLLLAACGSPDIRNPYMQANTSDPGQDAVRAEVLTLPYKDILWDHQFKDWKIARMTLGSEYLYLETPDNRVAAVDRFSGVSKWVLHVNTDTPLDWAPTEAVGVPEEIRELEKQIAAQARLVEDIIKAEGPGAKSQAAQRDRNNSQQRLRSAQRGDNVYFISRQILYCMVRTTGILLWTKRLPFAPSARPFATRDFIFVAGADLARVWRLDAEKKGEPTGEYPANAGSGDRTILNRPIVGSSLYFVSGDGHAYSYDVPSERQNWTYPTLNKLTADPILHEVQEKYKDSAGKEGVRKKRYLFIGGMDYGFYALDADNGSREWKYETAGHLKSAPTVKDETVYVRTEDGALFALELDPQHKDPKTGANIGTKRDGRLRWKLPLGDRFIVKTGKENVIVMGPNTPAGPSGELYQIKDATGDIIGRYPLNLLQYAITNPVDGILYVANGAGYVFALRESGEKY